ncbi:MAG: 30S ribosomal protein S6 [Polyangiales bacterium]
MTTEVQIDPKRATDYETVFILRPDIDAEGSEKAISRVVTAIEGTSGRLTKVESWGRRKLAYPVAKQRKGVYVYVRYLGFRGTVAEVERGLRMLDAVIRYQTVLNARDIDISQVTVDPEEVKVRRIELSSVDDERDETFEHSLGLADDQSPPPPPRREREPEVVEPAETPEKAEKPAGDA